MKKQVKFIGILMILAGVLTFAVSFLASFTDHNSALFTGLALVVAGVAVHVFMMKREGKY